MHSAARHRTTALARAASDALVGIDNHLALLGDSCLESACLDAYQALYSLIPGQTREVIDAGGPDLEFLLINPQDCIHRTNLLAQVITAYTQ